MTELHMRDVSPGGHELSRAVLHDLPARASIRDIVAHRIHTEVATYNAEPGPVFSGLVQPQDSMRYSDGFRMRSPRPLDAAHLMTAVEEAVAAGVVSFRTASGTVTDLDQELDTDAEQELVTVMQRPIVARAP